MGGLLEWTLPENVTGVTHYVVYLAEDEVGSNRQQLTFALSLNENVTIPVDTGISTLHSSAAVNYTYFLIYTRSSLLEQTTPTTLEIYDDFLYVCDDLPGISCGDPQATSAAAGAGKCSPSSDCNDCGLTAARLASVKEATVKGPLSIIGAAAHSDTHNALMMSISECGMSAEVTYYNARGMDNPAVEGSPEFMCRYGCLANLTSCRLCTPYFDNSSGSAPDDDAADADGLNVWRYLACRYRKVENAEGDDLKYSYVFGNGDFAGLGSEMAGSFSCTHMAMATASESIHPFSIENMGCGPQACSLELVDDAPSTDLPFDDGASGALPF